MGNIQHLDWGTIEWLFEPEDGSMDNMRVGISTMLPGTIQPKHIHCGDEQLMYVLSGHGRQRIGAYPWLIHGGICLGILLFCVLIFWLPARKGREDESGCSCCSKGSRRGPGI